MRAGRIAEGWGIVSASGVVWLWLVARAQEVSTWRGVAFVLAAFGVITVEQGAAVVGLIEILRREGGP